MNEHLSLAHDKSDTESLIPETRSDHVTQRQKHAGEMCLHSVSGPVPAVAANWCLTLANTFRTQKIRVLYVVTAGMLVKVLEQTTHEGCWHWALRAKLLPDLL